ncbi:MAG: VCBS repeat-containing protein [Gammaproteobacteria bacterium]|nr:VCBS repeat-containing protein [Gammaproteobacteria bacterium]
MFMRICRAASGAAALLFLGHGWAATASLYPAELVRGTTPVAGSQMAAADLNGDGLTDIVVADNQASGSNRGGVWVFLAQPGGGYDAPGFYATASQPYTVAIGDLDADGHPDIVTGNDGSATANQVSVLINNGDGTFKTHVDDSPQPAATFTADAVTVADATGDGLADVVLDASDSTVYVIPGSGAGSLNTAAVQALTLTGSSADGYGVAVTDVNGDGVPDLVVTNGCSAAGTADTVDVFIGRAGQPFSAAPSQHLSVGACPTVAIADINRDGAADVVVVNRHDASAQVLLDTAGSLLDSGTTYALAGGTLPAWARAADVDGDGKLDILAANAGSDSVGVLYGNGDGSFDPSPAIIPTGFDAADVAAADANGDGRLELIALDRSAGGLVVARNLGKRSFLSYLDHTYQDGGGNGKQAADMASADFNGDGKPDVVTANNQDNSLSVLLNDGQGGFKAPLVLTSTNASGVPNAVIVGDLNGDGNADIVTADSGGNLNAYLGNGDGTFQPKMTSPIVANSVNGLALGDLDGDGKPDVAVTENAAAQIQVCKGDGAGAFDCSAFAPVLIGTAAAKTGPFRVALSDVNGDGKLDLIASSSVPDTNVAQAWDAYVFLGDGNGGFVTPARAVLPVVGEGLSVDIGDANGDGRPDLLFGSFGASVELFTGNGDGTFGIGVPYATGVSAGDQPRFAIFADVNGDGHPDIVAANNKTDSLGVLLNDGTGRFGAAQDFAAGLAIAPVLALDMHGSGVLDLVAASRGDGSAINSNISVYRHNRPPTAQGTSLTVTGGGSGSGAVTGSDPEQDGLAFAVAAQPTHGTVSLDAASGQFTYTPANGYIGADSFTVTASDGVNLSAPATVSITVLQPAAPTLGGFSDVSVAAGQSVTETFSVSGGGPLTINAISSDQSLLPDSGIAGASSCTAAGSCTLTLTAVSDKLGTATVTVTAADGFGQSAQGSFKVTATKPAPPTLGGLADVTVAFGSSGTQTFTVNGTGTLSVSVTSADQNLLPDSGIAGASSCTAAGNCALTLTPATVSGATSVTVTVTDSFGQSAQGSFSFTVKPKPPSGGGGSGGGIGGFTLVGLAAFAWRRRRARS